MLDIIKNGLKNIWRKRLRSALTVTGIAIGVLSVVVISMIGDIGKAAINSELSSMGIGGIVVTSDIKKYEPLCNKDLEDIRNDSEIEKATPLMTKYSAVKTRNEVNDCFLWGIDSDTTKIVSMQLLHGRMLTNGDVSSMNRVCMVDESFALEYYGRTNIVGKTVEFVMGGVYRKFEVVGVAKAGGNVLQSLMGNVVPCFAYVPYTTMQSLSMEHGFNQIVAKTGNEVDTAALSQRISRQVELSSGIKVKVQDLNTQMDKLNNILNKVSLILTLIGGISLVVSGLSIMTVMLVSVSERTREIGIKKSIGASKRVILLEFISESFLLTAVGGILGIAVGLLIGISGCLLLGVGVIISIKTLLICMIFAVLVGMIFGIYPAMKAASLKPVDALRNC